MPATLTEAELLAAIAAGEVTCLWFARCDRTATQLVPHPAFDPGVPSCDRCQAVGR